MPRIHLVPLLLAVSLICPAATGVAQDSIATFTRADTLRGMLTPLRTCYDVRFYHLDVRIDPDSQSIQGSNTIRFDVLSPFTVFQIDLFDNLRIEGIRYESRSLRFDRELNAVYVRFPDTLRRGTSHQVVVEYSGKPKVAARPPWQVGFTWDKDRKGNPWVVVTSQGDGASLWWPNKDHQSDEPDSMLISVTVPPGLQDVSNGRLRTLVTGTDGWTRYDWFVANPINNYCVTVNVADYTHFRDYYVGVDSLTLDYYVLPESIDSAKAQFTQVKTMLGCFEKFFGPYPFYEDGYTLVETPYLGMEHQSAVAYGNHYLNGYRGSSSSPAGLTFDYIIVHESSHEWWGNSITSSDIADMWIHESFGTYAEVLYAEYTLGRQSSLDYVNALKHRVANLRPIIGPYNVNTPGADIYNKGALALNTLRSILDNDSLWFAILKGLQTTFRHSIVEAGDIFGYISKQSGRNLSTFFDQYFRHPAIPTFEATVTQKSDSTLLRYRWVADVPDFTMPIRIIADGNRTIVPTTTWQTLFLGALDPREFDVAEDLFYVRTKIQRAYLDPRVAGMGSR